MSVLSVAKKFVRRILKALGVRIVRLVDSPTTTLPTIPAVFAVFNSSRGETFELLEGYRKSVWGTDWNEMIRDRAIPSPEVVRSMGLVSKGRNQAESFDSFLKIHGLGLRDREILEIGCFDGAASLALVEAGARRVVGIDRANNFVPSPAPSPSEIEKSARWLDALRKEVRTELTMLNPDLRSDAVAFRDLDVCNIEERGAFDLIVSSATLEHVLDFPRAFQRMYTALRPGGRSLHQYHPFFCSSGAHFDTLDFPWGHVRLSPDDFRNYIRQFRSDEEEISEYRFFRTINRMTILDMENAARSAGFEIEALMLSGEDWRNVQNPILQQAQKNFPSLRVNDLTSTSVIVLCRKPGP